MQISGSDCVPKKLLFIKSVRPDLDCGPICQSLKPIWETWHVCQSILIVNLTGLRNSQICESAYFAVD